MVIISGNRKKNEGRSCTYNGTILHIKPLEVPQPTSYASAIQLWRGFLVLLRLGTQWKGSRMCQSLLEDSLKTGKTAGITRPAQSVLACAAATSRQQLLQGCWSSGARPAPPTLCDFKHMFSEETLTHPKTTTVTPGLDSCLVTPGWVASTTQTKPWECKFGAVCSAMFILTRPETPCFSHPPFANTKDKSDKSQ